MRAYLLVFVGGGIGAALRHGVNVTLARWLGMHFPFHTLFENVSGSIVMGLLAGYFITAGGTPQSMRLLLTTGILGGYTTFSAFSLDTVLLIERDQYGLALIYVAASVLAAIGGLALGIQLIRLTA
jgi:fluoride exporter